LHRIAVQAFGPFADRVEVDVESLAEHGLFLLHGPTGAGKTSLLDAVCFALYGSVPGARSSLRHTTLRSDHAAPGVAPLVECELTVGSRRIEVTRSPAWQRPKARGTGTTTEQASVRVRELVDGRWEPLASRLDEAGLLLSSLLGMDAQQFTTVVLLPQGDFATFLRAGPDERRSVLERLFGTDRFAAVESWLAQRRTDAGRALREAQAHRDQLLARVDERATALRDATDGTEGSAPTDAASPDGVDGARTLYELAATRLAAARDALGDQHGALEQLRTEAEEAAAAERREKELVEVLTARGRLAAEAAQVERRRQALERHAAALTLLPHSERLAAAEDELGTTAAGLDAALAALPRTMRSRDPEVLAGRAGALRAELGVLAALLVPEVEHATRQAELAEVAQDHRDLEAASTAVLVALDASAAERARLGPERDLAALAADRGPHARQELERALAVERAAHDAARLVPLVRAADDGVRRADDAAASARAHHLDLVERRLAGMAAELAGTLTAGESCPVCGADEHPAPATGTDAVAADEVAEALHEAEHRALAAREHRSARDALVRELSAAEQVASGSGVEQAAALVAAARVAVRTADDAAAALSVLDARLAALDDDDARHRAQAADLDRRRAWCGDRLAELRTRVGDTEARLREARGSDADVATRHARLGAELHLVDEALDRLRALPAAKRAVTVARREAASACRAAGFDDLDAVQAVVLPRAEHASATAAVARHDRELAGLEHRLERTDLGTDVGTGLATDLGPATDGTAAAAALAAATARLQQAGAAGARLLDAVRAAEVRVRALGARTTVLETTAVALHGLAEELEEHERATAGLAEEAAVLEELASCALGTGTSNALRMRLSAYVLAARLEQVAAAASVRLRATSAGRYELRHTDARGKGGGRSGLGLTVVDHWTGQERATATLSGGETFLASLALALGLADVVQAESGGLAIETLFVDEGFGSLDDDTLEMVMAGLDELREGGRAVGLVSHLPELRSRIPSQLHVVRGERGSTVRLLRAAG
jgi:exonuclease SbcC